jgi:hypothetical protein
MSTKQYFYYIKAIKTFYMILPIECMIAALPLILTVLSIIYFCRSEKIEKNSVMNQDGKIDLTRLESLSSYDSVLNSKKKLRSKTSYESTIYDD